MNTPDPYAHDDAAYVLGGLEPEAELAFETHLLDCRACRERVAEARETLALLDAVGGLAEGTDDHDLDADVLPPDTLLPGLLRRAGRERRRRRLLLGGSALAAAACAAAVLVAVWPGSGSDGSTPVAGTTGAFTPVRSVPVSASATLVSRQWGTEIRLQCRYTESLKQGTAYKLVVIDRDNNRFDAGGWTLGDEPTEFTGGTEVPRTDISAVQITLADGSPVLQLDP